MHALRIWFFSFLRARNILDLDLRVRLSFHLKWVIGIRRRSDCLICLVLHRVHLFVALLFRHVLGSLLANWAHLTIIKWGVMADRLSLWVSYNIFLRVFRSRPIFWVCDSRKMCRWALAMLRLLEFFEVSCAGHYPRIGKFVIHR